jgi:hypothetical protein
VPNRYKITVAALLTCLAIELCLVTVVVSVAFLEASKKRVVAQRRRDGGQLAMQAGSGSLGGAASTVAFASATPTGTPTATPTPTNTPPPTATATRVVLDTATPTPAPSPTHTRVLPANPPAAYIPPGTDGDVGQASVVTPAPSSIPETANPMKIIESQAQDTENTFFVIFAQITSNNALLPGYRIVGTHSPSGLAVESEPSCDHLCKASGPKTVGDEPACDSRYTPVACTTTGRPVQEGNVVFEAFAYETGVWSLVVASPEGNQASDVFQIEVDSERRQWFYYRFDLQQRQESG